MYFLLYTKEKYSSSSNKKLLRQVLEEIYHQDIISFLDDLVTSQNMQKYAKAGSRDSIFNNGSVKIAQIFSI